MVSLDLSKYSSCSISVWFSAALTFRLTQYLIVTLIRHDE